MMRKGFPAGFLAVAFLATGTAAQESRTEHLVHIVAVVGDSVITNLDIQDALLQMQPPPDSAQRVRLERQLLDELIDRLLLLQAAVRDTAIAVAPETVTRNVDRRLDQLRAQYGGEQGLNAALAGANLTPQTFREVLTQQIRSRMLIDAYIGKAVRERRLPPVSEEEIREFFEASVDTLLPRRITFRQVLISVQPSDSALAIARARADSVYSLARSGEDFAELARRWSEGPSAELGGDLGFFRMGQNIAEFDRAVFAPTAKQGDILGPIRTEFGLHVIRLERIRGFERHARHILIRPVIAEADRERTRTLADSIASRIRAGADVDSVARVHGVPEIPVRIGPLAVDSVAARYPEARALLDGAAPRETLGPVLVGEDGPTPRFLVLRVISVEEPRKATVDDYRDSIQEHLGREKLVAELLRDLRRRTWIDVRLGQDPGGGGPGRP